MSEPGDPRCAKCGSRDVETMYHEGESYWGDQLTCGYGSSARGWSNTTKGEHLHYRCKVCRFDWTAETLDSGTELRPTGDLRRIDREQPCSRMSASPGQPSGVRIG